MQGTLAYTKFGDIVCERDHVTIAVVSAFNKNSLLSRLFSAPYCKRPDGFLIESSKSQVEVRGNLTKSGSYLINSKFLHSDF